MMIDGSINPELQDSIIQRDRHGRERHMANLEENGSQAIKMILVIRVPLMTGSVAADINEGRQNPDVHYPHVGCALFWEFDGEIFFRNCVALKKSPFQMEIR